MELARLRVQTMTDVRMAFSLIEKCLLRRAGISGIPRMTLMMALQNG
jgi:hypothetical protein